MPIVVFCKACAKKIRVPDGPSGRKGKCPQCAAVILIPAESETAPPLLDKRTPVVADPDDEPAAPVEKHAAKTPEKPAAKAVPAPAPKSEPKPEPKPEPETKPEPQPEAPKAAPATQPGEKKKPKKIALNLGSAALNEAPEVSAEPEKKKAAPTGAAGKERKLNNAADRTAGMEVLKGKDDVEWGDEPEPPPNRTGFYAGLAAVSALLLIAFIAWWIWGRSVPHAAKDDRQKLREQFKLDKGSE